LPRQKFPEGIIEGKCSGYVWDGMSLEAQFQRYEYPLDGHSPVHMLYRFGGSSFGTVANSERYIEAYHHPSLEFIVNQSIWMENEVQFADVILPACTSLERWDISESANCGGFLVHNQNQLNHRMVMMQHKCIEPLGESKSDYQIFLDILTRLGLGAIFSEGGCDELTWCKRIFDSSDLPKKISWKDFVKKGYYVVPPDPPEIPVPVDMRWYAEGNSKDVPEPAPLPSQYAEYFGKGLPTQSGKFEFVPNSLRRIEKGDPDRPSLNRYIPAWEGAHSRELLGKYPLQLITTHPAYSFHTYGDGKNSHINEIKDHRILVDGYFYWVLRMNDEDAARRGLQKHDLVTVRNDRATVICALEISPLMTTGVVKGFASAAEYDEIQTPEGPADRGGCLNLLTPARMMTGTAAGIAPNSCLVEVRKWDRVAVKEAS